MTSVSQPENCNADALVAAVMDAIAAHLARHPSAGDTALGIAQWWLQMEPQTATPEIVDHALERLVRGGVLRVRELASGERFYFGPGNARAPS